MVSNTGDTIHCIGIGKQYFTTREFQPYGNPECAGHGTEKLYEAYKIEFIDSVKGEKIELEHYYYHTYNDKIRYDDVGVLFKGEAFLITDSHISNKNVQNYFGDVMLQNFTYKAVNRVKNYNSLSDSLSFMFINRTNGIIKLQLNNLESWEVIRK